MRKFIIAIVGFILFQTMYSCQLYYMYQDWKEINDPLYDIFHYNNIKSIQPTEKVADRLWRKLAKENDNAFYCRFSNNEIYVWSYYQNNNQNYIAILCRPKRRAAALYCKISG